MLVDAPRWALKLLLVSHVIAAGVSLGASVHFALLVRNAVPAQSSLLRLYPTVALVSWATLFALGSAIYPNYRLRVRAEYLDLHARWVSTLFDVKENLAVLVAPLLLAQWLLTRRSLDAQSARVLRACAWVSAVCVAFNFVAGLLVTSYRSV